jgi:hypothetical protein
MVQNAAQKKNPITYQVTVNGGTGDPHSAGYKTSRMTFTFDEVPLVMPTFEYIPSLNYPVSIGPLTRTSNPLEFYATASINSESGGDVNLNVTCTNGQASNVTTVPRYVHIFGGASVNDIFVKRTRRYIFNGVQIKDTVVQRNTEHQLECVLNYDIVYYDNGVENSRDTYAMTKSGEWLVDSSIGCNYISIDKNGLLKIGSRPTGTVVYHENDKEGVSDWKFDVFVEFGQVDGSEIVDGMPYTMVPVYFGPFQIGTRKVYGIPVTLTIVN